MPVQIIECDFLFKIFGDIGQAHFGFLILIDSKAENKETIIRHEKIHLQQQKELGILPFYLIYGIDYLIKYNKYRHKKIAYKKIVFEVEAYREQDNKNYKRKPYECWR